MTSKVATSRYRKRRGDKRRKKYKQTQSSKMEILPHIEFMSVYCLSTSACLVVVSG